MSARCGRVGAGRFPLVRAALRPESCEEDRFARSGGACQGSTPGGEVGVQSEAEAMLLDRYLPHYDVTEAHAVVVDANTDLTWRAVRRSDLGRSAVIRVLLELRSLPNRLQGVLKGRPSGPARPPLTLDDMERVGFVLLGESPGHEIVFGTVVQPWKPVTGDEPAPRVERRPVRRVRRPWVCQGRLQHPGGALRQRARSHHDRDTDGGHRPCESAPLRPLLAARWPVQRADPPPDAADREIRCRATTWPHEHHRPTRRVSLAAPPGPAGWCQRIGDREPGSRHNTLARSPTRRPVARDCRSLPT